MILPQRDPWQPWSIDSLPPGALDLLNTLRDIHEPAAPGFWPPAPGWWLLALLLLLLLAWAGLQALQRQRRRRPVRQAFAELDVWQRRATAAGDPAVEADALAALLKRVALTRYPRHRVARLSGDAWLDFLDRTGATAAFSQGPGRILGDARYAPAPDLRPEPLAALAREWLHRHLDGPPETTAEGH